MLVGFSEGAFIALIGKVCRISLLFQAMNIGLRLRQLAGPFFDFMPRAVIGLLRNAASQRQCRASDYPAERED